MRKLLLVAMSLLMLQQALAFDLIMPNQIVSGEPFEFTIVMDDPRLQKLVHTIIVRCHGQCPIIRRKSDKHIHWEYNYSGEKEVVFEGVGFWREYEDTTEGEFTITLLADIEKQREMFADMTTYMEDVAFIRRGISVLPVSFSADLPEYDCDWKLENFDTVTFPPDFRCFGKGDYYSEFKFMGGMAGRGTCTNEDPEYMACNVGFPRSLYENPEEDMEVGQEDFGTGGEGYYYYKKSQSVAYYDSDGNKVYNLEPFLRYAVLDGMVIHSGDIRKQVMIKTDDPDAEFEDIKQEMFSMIRSFKWVGKGGGQGHEITKKINLPVQAL